jgi:hypothetical protein
VLNRFEDVALLSSLELRVLSTSELAEQRIWAVWALALREGGAETQALVQQVSVGDPSPGVRRALVMVLAGAKALDLMCTIGRDDPAPEVRAQAMQILARMAAVGTVQTEVVVEAFARERETVRIAILGAVEACAPSSLVSLGFDGLLDRHVDVQAEAFEMLMRTGTAPGCRRAWPWLSDAKTDVARAGASRLPRGLTRTQLRTLQQSPLATRIAAICLLAVPIDELFALAKPGEYEVFDTLRGRADFGAAPLAMLVDATLGGAAYGYLEVLHSRLVETKSLEPQFSSHLLKLQRRCLERLETTKATRAERAPHGWRWPRRAHYRAVLAECERLLDELSSRAP